MFTLRWYDERAPPWVQTNGSTGDRSAVGPIRDPTIQGPFSIRNATVSASSRYRPSPIRSNRTWPF